MNGTTNTNTATLLISNVTVGNYGQYSCAISDANGTLSSAPATLYPLVRPLVWLAPANPLIVPAGQAIPVSAVISNGWPPPFGWPSSGMP